MIVKVRRSSNTMLFPSFSLLYYVTLGKQSYKLQPETFFLKKHKSYIDKEKQAYLPSTKNLPNLTI